MEHHNQERDSSNGLPQTRPCKISKTCDCTTMWRVRQRLYYTGDRATRTEALVTKTSWRVSLLEDSVRAGEAEEALPLVSFSW